MFQDVDESLRALLIADVPIERSEVEISFERPTREWSGRLTRPTINLFMYDVRERTDFRDDAWVVKQQTNGRFERTRPPRRVDLAYLLTAWTKEPADEHRILGRVLPALYRNLQIAEEYLKGDLVGTTTPVLARVMPPDYLAKPADFWGVMDNELRAGLVWVITAPLDVFRPATGPLVSTSVISVRDAANEDARETFVRVGGYLHADGDADAPVVGATVQVSGTGASAVTGEDGRFVFPWVPSGKQTWRIQAPEQQPFDVAVEVPSEGYTVALKAPGAEPARSGRSRRARSSEE